MKDGNYIQFYRDVGSTNHLFIILNKVEGVTTQVSSLSLRPSLANSLISSLAEAFESHIEVDLNVMSIFFHLGKPKENK